VLSRFPEDIREQLKTIFDDGRKFIGMLQITDKQTSAKVRFELNDEQEYLFDVLQKHRLVVVLKPRQIGISTLLRAYALWQAYTSPDPVKWGVVSFHDRSAKHLRRVDTQLLRSLPRLLQREMSVDNATTAEFADTEASLSSFTAGSKGGTRSFTLTSAHLSEFAFYDDAAELLATLKSTVGNGQIIIETTPNVPGDAFHRLVSGAPENGWHLVTFWWHQHQKYRLTPPANMKLTEEEEQLKEKHTLDNAQLYWRRMEVATVGREKFRREYPGSLNDAFHYSAATYFHSADLDAIEAIHFTDSKREYEKPHEDDVYAMGVDVAAGVRLDYSAITVISMSTLQPVFHYRSNTITPTDFADVVLQTGQHYNSARVLVESNNHGHVVLYRLRHMGYRNLWRSHDGKDWTTSVKSKLDAYETLREFVSNQLITRLDATALYELRSLVVRKVTPEAPRGLHDDMAMSVALAYRCTRDISRRQIRNARRSRMDELLKDIKVARMKSQPSPWTVNT